MRIDVDTTKVAVTIDTQLLREVDRWVAAGEFPSRSRAFREALEGLRERRRGAVSLIAELDRLDPAEEQALAEQWTDGESSSL